MLMECSNRGICNRDTGLCECQDIFEGNACERLKCPSGSNGKICSGYGVCATMAEMASLRVVNGELTPTTYVVFVLRVLLLTNIVECYENSNTNTGTVQWQTI